jgi:U3 small nucleolar ribonucleoprotein protein LCP5
MANSGSGLSLLLVRPQCLLSSLHQLVVLTALQLVSNVAPGTSSVLPPSLASRSSRYTLGNDQVAQELAGELLLEQEIMDKVRGLEAKIDYQIKKLVGLAEAEEARGNVVVEEVDEGEHWG